MMHLGKCKAYLTCNLGTRRCHTSNIECCHVKKLNENIQWVQNRKHIQVFEKLVYHPHKD